jgi:hypothetical protein
VALLPSDINEVFATRYVKTTFLIAFLLLKVLPTKEFTANKEVHLKTQGSR